MAARTQPSRKRHGLIAACAIGAVALAAMGRPANASAHSATVVNALDFRAQVTSTGRSGVVSARILDGDRRLELAVAPAATVIVLGYQGEPLLRFSPGGVEVNERSPSAITNRLARRGAVPALDPHAAPEWVSVSDSHRFAWHDHRLGPTPGHPYAQGNVGHWRIPLVVRGHADAISGRLLHRRGPPSWPWFVLIAATAGVALALASLRGRRHVVERTTYLGAAVGGFAAAAASISFGFVPGRSALDAWAVVVVCGTGAAAALALFISSPRTRIALAGFVGLIALLVGVSDAAVLVHGFVIATLPATTVRIAIATACSAGLLATTCAAALQFQPDRPRSSPRARRPRMAIPRGRP